MKKPSIPISSGNILYVGGTGEGNYSNIQDAIDNTSDGDTVFVYNGTYYENITIYKSINLIGEDKNTTVIDGIGEYRIVYVIADLVNISGFTIVNSSSSSGRGITLHSKYNNIADNIITGFYGGIHIQSYQSHNNITGNIILYNEYGINLGRHSHNNTVNSNKLYFNTHAIFMYTSNYNKIIGNTVSDSRYGIRVRMWSNHTKVFNNNVFNSIIGGIYIDSSNAIVKGNNLSNNTQGIRLYDSTYSTILENNISNNADGVFMHFISNYNIIKDNMFQNNGNGIYQDSKSNNNNVITNNNFISNEQYGIHIYSTSNTVTDNIISNNFRGMLVDSYGENIIKGNTFLNDGLFVRDSYQNTVTNNIVNGKPLVFLEDKSDMTIDIDAGQVILINCDNVNVINQDISDTNVGITLLNTINSFISSSTVSNNDYGIYIYSSQINVTDNNISNNERGIYLDKSSNSTITNNIISNNDDGIYLTSSNSKNTIASNYILTNKDGITIYNSKNNIIYDNYFDNTNNVYDIGNNTWNIDKTIGPNIIGGPYLGGNYWSNYNGEDLDGDGLGDTDLPYNCFGDIRNGGDWLPYVNSAPEIPDIDGPAKGKPGIDYDYTFVATDPNGDDVLCFVDWGDGSNSSWLGPYPSGEEINLSHNWEEEGTYLIRAKAKDIYDFESDWAEFEIEIPRNRMVSNLWFQWFLERFPILNRLLLLMR